MISSPETSRPILLSPARARELLRQMLRIRRFEERCAELYQQGKVRGFLHLYIGEEAVAVGAVGALDERDALLCTYREHGHALARGLSMEACMAEMYGKQEGCSRGRGGSMHLFDASRRFYGGNAIVAGHLPLAVGLGMAEKMQGREGVVVCFFGEGAMAEGEFHESMNLAALWGLPVIFCCENNGYAMGTALAISESQTDLCVKAASYGMPAQSVDGMDVLAVAAAMDDAVASTRGGGGPRFLELRTYRFRAHSMFDAQLYRDKAEVERWKQRDPIEGLLRQGLEAGLFTAQDREQIEVEVQAEVQASVAFAEAGTWEPPEELCRDVCTPWDGAVPAPAVRPPEGQGPRTMTGREAMRQAIREALQSDPRVFLMGEDVAHYGGCYAVSKGLLDEFGEERVRDTPLSEAGFTGAGIGAAMGGMRPIVEIMSVNFSLLALDQILNNAATLRHMSGGQLSVPLVIRMATGAGRQLAAQHSHSLEGWFAHIPGLRVLVPGTVADLRAMLWAALADPDPVLIFENVTLYNLEEELPAEEDRDIDHARVRRAGEDLSIFAWGGCLPKAMQAAEVLAGEGIRAEVVDLRVLRPLDRAAILASVGRTRRAVIVDEGWRTGSFAAEVAACIGELAFYELDAPVERVCAQEVPIPYPAHLEQLSIPQVEGIVAAARRVVGSRIPRAAQGGPS